jgi:sulfate adenylyltransferase subunit 1 (EFTu-like GTPase family)
MQEGFEQGLMGYRLDSEFNQFQGQLFQGVNCGHRYFPPRVKTDIPKVVPQQRPAHGSQDSKAIDVVLNQTIDVSQYEQLSRVVRIPPEL